jgi:hypothetical protein
VWSSDITSVRLQDEFVYLAVLMAVYFAAFAAEE